MNNILIKAMTFANPDEIAKIANFSIRYSYIKDVMINGVTVPAYSAVSASNDTDTAYVFVKSPKVSAIPVGTIQEVRNGKVATELF